MAARALLAALAGAALLVGAPRTAAAQSGPAQPQPIVRGSAVLGDNPTAARERALRQAFRLAVEQVAGVMIESETLSRNLALFEDNILTRTEGYVRDYSILSERTEDGLLTLEVKVDVVAGPLSDDIRSLGILLRRADYPLLAVELFATGNVELPPDVGPRLESEARAVLRDRGLEVVEPNGSGLDPVVRVEGTLEWADQGDPLGTGLHSATAIVAMQAVEEATGSVIAAARSRSRGAGISPPAARDRAGVGALEDALEGLVDDLVDTWSSRVNNRDAVLVSVRGVTDYGQVTALIDAIHTGFEETEDVVERQVAVDRGTAFLEWRGRSGPGALAAWLSGRRAGQYRISVVGTGGNMVQIELRDPA